MSQLQIEIIAYQTNCHRKRAVKLPNNLSSLMHLGTKDISSLTFTLTLSLLSDYLRVEVIIKVKLKD